MGRAQAQAQAQARATGTGTNEERSPEPIVRIVESRPVCGSPGGVWV